MLFLEQGSSCGESWTRLALSLRSSASDASKGARTLFAHTRLQYGIPLCNAFQLLAAYGLPLSGLHACLLTFSTL